MHRGPGTQREPADSSTQVVIRYPWRGAMQAMVTLEALKRNGSLHFSLLAADVLHPDRPSDVIVLAEDEGRLKVRGSASVVGSAQS